MYDLRETCFYAVNPYLPVFNVNVSNRVHSRMGHLRGDPGALNYQIPPLGLIHANTKTEHYQ